jgi:predicted nucleic acid-binding protein
MEIVYVDTNVYLDWFLWRKGRGFLWHQGEEALVFFNNVKAGKYLLLTSDHLEAQIKYIQLDTWPQYSAFISELDAKQLHKHVTTTPQDRTEANSRARISGAEFEDTLHFVLAKKGGATRFVTQNEPHFRQFRTEMHVSRPRFIDFDICQ